MTKPPTLAVRPDRFTTRLEPGRRFLYDKNPNPCHQRGTCDCWGGEGWNGPIGSFRMTTTPTLAVGGERPLSWVECSGCCARFAVRVREVFRAPKPQPLPRGLNWVAAEVPIREWLETGFLARKTPTLATAAEGPVRWAAIWGVGAAGGWRWGGVFVAQKTPTLATGSYPHFSGDQPAKEWRNRKFPWHKNPNPCHRELSALFAQVDL